MNHRELILSCRKKARFAFLALPEDLQDAIIEGLDGQTMTLEGSRDWLADRGHSLSHEAIAGYYRAVRMERRRNDDDYVMELEASIIELKNMLAELKDLIMELRAGQKAQGVSSDES